MPYKPDIECEDQLDNALQRIDNLEQQNRALVEALKNLLAMAKYYKPIPKGYNPTDEDEDMWEIAGLYYRVEQALALAEANND